MNGKGPLSGKFMIKLTVDPESKGIVKNFNKNSVVIGSGDEPISDLSLPGEHLEPVHIKIERTAENFYILNAAHDPFATLNGNPFGRRKLVDNDMIQIGNTLIKFNAERPVEPLAPLQTIHKEEKWLNTGEESLQQIIENKIILKNETSITPSQMEAFSYDQTNEIPVYERSEEEELNRSSSTENEEIQQILNEFDPDETIDQAKISLPLSTPPIGLENHIIKNQKNPKSLLLKSSLKDSYLNDFEDESEVWNQHKKTIQNESRNSLPWNLKSLSVFGASSLVFIVILGCILFFNLRAKNLEEELEAGEGMADISMALAFAQLNHVKPLNQNWSDIDFLRNNLMAVLASEYTPAPFFENYGQFKNNEYSLRIYSSADLSQFLIIAQPTPGLLQWLMPKASILVDSKSMEIRRTMDLKSLNKLLLNPNNLEGMNAVEISNLIKQGDIIPLNDLSANGKGKGYVLSKSLALIRPGAENAIYNAPRYYPLGETFLRKSLMITDNYINQYELSLIQDEIRQLGKYPNLVFYTTRGLKWLQKSQKAVEILYPHNNFLFATLILDSKGKVLDSHLIMDSKSHLGVEDTDLIELSQLMEKDDKYNSYDLEFNDPIAIENTLDSKDIIEEKKVSFNENAVETSHPLYRDLLALSTTYKNALLPLEVQLEKLFDIDHREDIIFFLSNLQSLLKRTENLHEGDQEKLEKNNAVLFFLGELTRVMQDYHSIKLKEQQNLSVELARLQQTYSTMPIAEFLTFMEALGLKEIGRDVKEINKTQDLYQDFEALELKIQLFLKSIVEADNLASIEQNLTELITALTLDKVSDSKKLIDFQNEIRLTILEKLNDFLLTSGKSLPAKEYVVENRAILANILKSAWVIDPDEFDFYLNEFDLRLQELSTPELSVSD